VIPFPGIDPVAVHIGPLAIRWYGLAYVTGILSAWWLIKRRAAARPASGWTEDQVGDLIFYVALGLVIGGRLGHVLFYDFPVYVKDPLAVFKVWQGGMSFHGGLIGVLLAAACYARKAGKRFLEVTDLVAPVVPIGLLLGRLSNFVNAELWGTPTDLPWGVVFPDPAAGDIPRHPSQIYEALLEGVLLFAFLWIFSKKPRAMGVVSGAFLVGYGCARFLVEFVRAPDVQLGYLALGWLTMGQVLTVPMLLAGLWLCLRPRR
jgi:phosphatidylglycerol---prolipoprotein diacylglyceryl transferase